MIYPIRRIVAGVASLDAENPVLVGAIDVAERTGATLHLVHAYELPSLVWDAYGRMGYVDSPTLAEFSDSLQEQLMRAVAARSRGLRVEYHTIAAPPATALRDVAEEQAADLMIVGATRHGALSRALLGTTAQRVVRQAAMPVLVLREPLERPLRKVLLTTDLGPFSAGVHELGLDVIDTLGAGGKPELRSVLVVGPVVHLPSPLTDDVVDEIAYGQLVKFLENRRDRGVPIQGAVRIGEPAEEIVKEAEAFDPALILVGTHSRTVVERWLTGSVAEATIRETGSNVLVIPAGVEEQRQLPVPVERTQALTVA